MKKQFCRIIAVLLVMCTLWLCACSKSEEENNNITETIDTSASEGLFQKIYDDLPETMDFNGQEINVAIRQEDKFSSEFLGDETLGSVVGSAVYERNKQVEGRLNVKINYITFAGEHGPWADIRTSLTSGAGGYDVAVGSSAQASKEVANGIYRNLRNVENLDLSKEYWSQGMLKNMTLSNATYFATGSISTYFYDSALVIYFNRKLCDERKIYADDLYNNVSNGSWTIENMISLTKDIYDDSNGNGITDDGDLYGFGMQVTSATDGFVSSCNLKCTSVADDGRVTLDINIEKLGTIVKQLNDFVWSNDGVVALSENQKLASENVYLFDNQFANDKILFVTDWLYSTSTHTMRNMESDYGILPYPKYDSDQANYYTYAHDQLSVVGIPQCVNGDRLPMVGAFLEAMASSGQNMVMPAYYEKALTGQYVRDYQSVKMMDMIVRNISNDRIWFLYYKGITPLLREQIWKNTSNYSSQYIKIKFSADKNMETAHTSYAQNSNS